MNSARKLFIFILLICIAILWGCASTQDDTAPSPNTTSQSADLPEIPKKLSLNEKGVPILNVYQVDEGITTKMDVDTYLQGVLAGEMKNDWPLEALKAQAILARTFVMKFCNEKTSSYASADISTDIEEAQAYDSTGINDRIIQAVADTSGMVLSNHGEFPYAWFCAHSGGKTALAVEGLGYQEKEPDYTQVVDGMESNRAPEDAAQWTATFTNEEIIQAAKKCGSTFSSIDSVSNENKGESGRSTSIVINGTEISAPEFRIAIGSSKMRSTMLSSLEKKDDGSVTMSGKGYGHGVGMPQWGAYNLAEQGKSAQEIVLYYFRNVTVEKIW